MQFDRGEYKVNTLLVLFLFRTFLKEVYLNIFLVEESFWLIINRVKTNLKLIIQHPILKLYNKREMPKSTSEV